MATRHGVLVAEPGAGKTTLVPPALLGAPWLTGRVIVLEPRRVVARAAARRLAAGFGEAVGGTVGTRMRSDTQVSARTRIEVVTEGILTRLAQDDPELTGIGALVFDEFHERSLDADLGLALGLDIARSLRPDLRILAMSATIDAGPLAAMMDGAAVLRSAGRLHPVTLRHRPIPPRARIEEEVAHAVRAVLRGQGTAEEADCDKGAGDRGGRGGSAGEAGGGGSVLAFLPGRAEVARTVRLLRAEPNETIDVLPLHGGLDAREQDRAVAPSRPGTRKVVVATPIAESSLTIEGVDTVIDAGLVREPVHDHAVGITRLETRRASRASVDQRAGRAGRTGPGTAWRLWPEAATKGLPPVSPPEIARTDLSGLILDVLDWGVPPAALGTGLSWLDPPARPALLAGIAALKELGAVTVDRPERDDAEREDAGRAVPGVSITAFGRALRALPLGPREAAALLFATPEARMRVARWVALLSEPGLGGDAVDLAARERAHERDRSDRAREVSALAARWAKAVARPALEAEGTPPTLAAAAALARAWPGRVARARGPSRPDGRRAYLMASGRGAWLAADDTLASSEWIVALGLTGRAREQRVTAAIGLSRAEFEEALGERVEERVEARLDEASGRLEAFHRRMAGAIILDERRTAAHEIDPEARALALAEALRARGIDRLPWGDRSGPLRARLAWLRVRSARPPARDARSGNGDGAADEDGARDGDGGGARGGDEDDAKVGDGGGTRGEGGSGGASSRAGGVPLWPDVSDPALAATLGDWLLPFLPGAAGLDAIDDALLADALTALAQRAEAAQRAQMAGNARMAANAPMEGHAPAGGHARDMDRLAPSRFLAPTGTRAPIDYPPDGSAPRLAIRVQELFGLDRHPHVAGEALVLDLLSPARRPIQTTRDLPGFWRGSWAEVRRDMRARYPRHSWPEDPANAEPTTRARPRKR